MQSIRRLSLVAVVAVAVAITAVATASSAPERRGAHHHHARAVRGTVKSFTDGALTITTRAGRDVTGAVTARTEIECADAAPAARAASTRSRGSDDERGDDRGRDEATDDRGRDGAGDDRSGDDRGRDDAGDDRGGDDRGRHDAGDDRGADDRSKDDAGDDRGADDRGRHDAGDDRSGDDADASCGASALTAGAKVREAKLVRGSSRAVWREVEVVAG